MKINGNYLVRLYEEKVGGRCKQDEIINETGWMDIREKLIQGLDKLRGSTRTGKMRGFCHGQPMRKFKKGDIKS